MFLRGTVISGIDISNYSYVCSKGLCYVLFKIPFWHWKDRAEIWGESKWGRKSSSFSGHCVCVDACFVCALWWVSLDEAACPKGVQSVFVSETVWVEIRTRGVRTGLGECGRAKLVEIKKYCYWQICPQNQTGMEVSQLLDDKQICLRSLLRAVKVYNCYISTTWYGLF